MLKIGHKKGIGGNWRVIRVATSSLSQQAMKGVKCCGFSMGMYDWRHEINMTLPSLIARLERHKI